MAIRTACGIGNPNELKEFVESIPDEATVRDQISRNIRESRLLKRLLEAGAG